MKFETPTKIPILDINLSAFQALKNNPPELHLQGTRVVFLFNANNIFYQLSAEYNSNTKVSVLDFVSAQRQLKAKMLSLRSGL